MKKILKNKYVIILLIIADIIISLFIIYQIGMLYGIIISLIGNILIIDILFTILFNINLFNYKKLFVIIKNKKINKSLDEDEFYLKKLHITTFDGTGSLTHPSTLYFENGFNGYKFWMVYTPYDNNNVELENPSIAVSNDGINWEEPKGLNNPLLPIIKKQKPNTYYNDPFLLYTDKLEIWYRHTIEADTLIDKIYRITSTNGINWTRPELIIKDDKSHYISLSILKRDDTYYMYYFNTEYKFNFRISKDLINWSEERLIDVNGFGGQYWHGEVKLINGKAHFLFMDKLYNLYLAMSDDLITFGKCKKFKSNYYSNYYLYSNAILYKSSLLIIKDMVYLYIPYKIDKLNLFRINRVIHKKWKLTLTKFNINKIDKFFNNI